MDKFLQYWPNIVSFAADAVVIILYLIYKHTVKKTKEVIISTAKDNLEKVDIKNNKVREEIEAVKVENEELRKDVNRLYRALSRIAGEEVENNGQLSDDKRD